MKNFRFRSGMGLGLIALYIFTLGLVIVAAVTTNYLLMGLGIVLSCFQYYLHGWFKRSYNTVKNYPFDNYLKDIFSFVPQKVSQLFVASSPAATELTKRERLLFAKRSKNMETEVVEDNLLNKYTPGFEYLKTQSAFMSLSPSELRVEVGTAQCLHPYSLNVYNFGGLDGSSAPKKSAHALSQAANISSCAVKSGQRGLTPELVRGGGDIVWQIDFGDVALRNPDRSFNQGMIKAIAGKPYIKMIEVRLHSTYDAEHQKRPGEAAIFELVSKLQGWSGGKPVGIHLLNPSSEMVDMMVRSIVDAKINLDFISIEESWGQNRLLYKEIEQRFFEAVFTAKALLLSYGMNTKVIATGVILTEYDILRLCALGADACFSSASTLVGNGSLHQKLISLSRPSSIRFANFHRNTLEATRELMQRCGYEQLSEADPADFYRRINAFEIVSLREIFCQKEQERIMPSGIHLN